MFNPVSFGGDAVIIILTKSKRRFYVKSPYGDSSEKALFDSIIEKYCKMDTRAISVELDSENHSDKSTTILCEDIERIWRQ